MKKILILSLISFISYSQVPNWIKDYPRIENSNISIKLDKPSSVYILSTLKPLGRLTPKQIVNHSLTGIYKFIDSEILFKIPVPYISHYFYITAGNSDGLNTTIKRFTRLQNWEYISYGTYVEDVNYTTLLPTDYYNKTISSPLLISIHGDGEKAQNGVGIETLIHGAVGRPPYMAEHNINFDPFILVSPQLPWWFSTTTVGANALNKLIEDVKTKYRVDTTRIYLTGLSGGGQLPYTYPSAFPKKIAASVPVCASPRASGYSKEEYSNMAKTAYWCFHNSNDKTVGVGATINMVNSINNSNPITPAIKTIYSASGHDAWTATYNKTNNPNDIYSWMLKYSTATTTSSVITTVSNIALGKTVVVDSNLPWIGFDQSKSIDNSASTYWNSANSTGGHWIYVDLQKLYTITKIVVKHHQTNSYLITKDFTIQYYNGSEFVTTNSYIGNVSPITTDNVNISARYIKINITKPSQYGTAAAIYELEVYGY